MSIYKANTRKNQRGFTLIEMVVIAPIVILTIGAFITAIVNMTGDVLVSRGANVLSFNIQDALSRIEQDVKLSTNFLATNTITFDSGANPQGFNDNTANFYNVNNVDSDPATTDGNVLILNTLATTGNPLSVGSGVVYLNGTPNDCSTNATQVNQNNPMTMNVVYFIKTVDGSSSLWRRTITPVDYLTSGATTAGCNTIPWQQPSCSPGYTSAFCKTQDTKLVEVSSINDFTVQYFNNAGSTLANSAASDTNLTAEERKSALQSSTTVNVSLNVSKMVAGRTVSQSGAIRTTRLDINASTIANPIQDVIPAAPTVTASAINSATPTTTTFTWETVPGANTYSIEYRIDAWDPVTLTNATGTWTSGFSNQTTTTYSKIVDHGDKVYVRVTATSPAGSSGYGTNNITVPVWAPMLLQNNWTTFTTTSSSPSFTKTKVGMVVLKGIVKGGTATVGLPIATLPEGYRPSERLIFENDAGGNPGRVDVESNGYISYNVGSNASYTLDDISFMSSDDSSFAPLSFQNSWVNYGSPFAQAASMVDDAGRVQLNGLVKSGVASVITTLPSGSWPSEYLHIVNINTNANSHISINSSGNVLFKIGSNGFLSLQASFFPSARGDGSTCTTQWCTLTLQSGWVHYGNPYATPRYTKAVDGVVQLKGLIKSGTITPGTVIAALPAGFCPKQQLLLTAQGADAWARLLITAGTGSGCQVQTSYVSASWTTLDAVNFLAEW